MVGPLTSKKPFFHEKKYEPLRSRGGGGGGYPDHSDRTTKKTTFLCASSLRDSWHCILLAYRKSFIISSESQLPQVKWPEKVAPLFNIYLLLSSHGCTWKAVTFLFQGRRGQIRVKRPKSSIWNYQITVFNLKQCFQLSLFREKWRNCAEPLTNDGKWILSTCTGGLNYLPYLLLTSVS